MREGTGTLIAFAAADGQRAADTGLFARQLTEALREPGLPVRELFYRVQERVYEASEHRQFPYIYSGVVGEFFFRSGATKPAPKVDAAFEAWGLVKDSQNPRISMVSRKCSHRAIWRGPRKFGRRGCGEWQQPWRSCLRESRKPAACVPERRR